VFSFAIAWALSRKANGSIALRIDNLDNHRFRPEYVQDIYDSLHFLGLDYDEGPRTLEDFHTSIQSEHRLKQYEEVLALLEDQHLVYACTCSRSQVAQHHPQSLYSRVCLGKKLPLDSPDVSWRIEIPEDTRVNFRDELVGPLSFPLGLEMPDFVVRRKDHMASYQIASLCDDLRMGCTLIVRGEDLIPSTAAQLHLAKLIDAPSFLRSTFVHHRLLKDATGEKLSKSQNALSIHEIRKSGHSSFYIWNQISQLLGWEEPVNSAKGFLERFRLSHLISTSP
jgi:glutamyl-tRNA synthetase